MHRPDHLGLARSVVPAQAGLQLVGAQRPGQDDDAPGARDLSGVRPLQTGTADGVPRNPERLAAGAVHLNPALVDGHVRVRASTEPAGCDPVKPVPGVHRPQVEALERRGEDGAGLAGNRRQVGKVLLLPFGPTAPGSAHPADRGHEQQQAAEGEQQVQAQAVGTALRRRRGDTVRGGGERGGEGEMVGHTIFPSSTVGRPRKNVAWTRPGSLRPA